MTAPSALGLLALADFLDATRGRGVHPAGTAVRDTAALGHE
ncbi:hypothetical protein [Rubellimicrobium rubrum]|nr:hypothetical protein [Rubellimicrobium rubrum]